MQSSSIRRVVAVLMSAGVIAISAAPEATTFSGGGRHTCAVDTSNGVQCWGDNDYGQIGDGTKTDRKTPVPVAMLTGVKQVATGIGHSCALTSSGEVHCWGGNHHGQIGNNSTVHAVTPVKVNGLPVIKQIALGRAHSCALDNDGAVYCWGANRYGQALGQAGGAPSLTPVKRYAPGTLGGTAAQISAGAEHTCLWEPGNGAFCWGRDIEGQFIPPASGALGELYGGNDVLRTSAGWFHSCALLLNGDVYCTGMYPATMEYPADSSGPSDPIEEGTWRLPGGASQIASGANFTCALLTSGKVACWGDNTFGQLGGGAADWSGWQPNGSTQDWVEVSGISNAVSIATGYFHACAQLASGQLQCWGRNSYGQLGTGTTTWSDVPVASFSNAKTACADATCPAAVCVAGKASCNGDNSDGCEVDLRTAANCGGCGMTSSSCPSGKPDASCSPTFSAPFPVNGCENIAPQAELIYGSSVWGPYMPQGVACGQYSLFADYKGVWTADFGQPRPIRGILAQRQSATTGKVIVQTSDDMKTWTERGWNYLAASDTVSVLFPSQVEARAVRVLYQQNPGGEWLAWKTIGIYSCP